jgi:hypothetical protein
VTLRTLNVGFPLKSTLREDGSPLLSSPSLLYLTGNPTLRVERWKSRDDKGPARLSLVSDDRGGRVV